MAWTAPSTAWHTRMSFGIFGMLTSTNTGLTGPRLSDIVPAHSSLISSVQDVVAVSEAMLEMWASFVVTGDPTPPGSSVAASWDPVTPGDQRYLVIGEEKRSAPLVC